MTRGELDEINVHFFRRRLLVYRCTGDAANDNEIADYSCLLPVCIEGYYMSGGICRACPVGTFKDSIGDSANCVQCGTSMTTLNTGATSSAQCCMYTILFVFVRAILFEILKEGMKWKLWQTPPRHACLGL